MNSDKGIWQYHTVNDLVNAVKRSKPMLVGEEQLVLNAQFITFLETYFRSIMHWAFLHVFCGIIMKQMGSYFKKVGVICNSHVNNNTSNMSSHTVPSIKAHDDRTFMVKARVVPRRDEDGLRDEFWNGCCLWSPTDLRFLRLSIQRKHWKIKMFVAISCCFSWKPKRKSLNGNWFWINSV